MRLKGHTKQGMAASIPKKKPLRISKVRLKGHKQQGMAAGIPKTYALQGAMIDRRR